MRWGRALTAWVPGLESVDQYGAALGGSPQVWQAGTNNNNRGPRSAWRGARPVAGQRQTMWSASLIHLTLCALFAHNARVPHRPLNDCESAGGPEGGFVENVPAHSPQPNAEHGGGGAGGGYGARVETRTWGRDKKFLCQRVRAFSLSGGMRERERACEREAEGEKSLFKTDAVNKEDSEHDREEEEALFRPNSFERGGFLVLSLSLAPSLSLSLAGAQCVVTATSSCSAAPRASIPRRLP